MLYISMGIFGLNINTKQLVTNYARISHCRSILATKTPEFHGVNIHATYPPLNKTFALPRFISVEMIQARKLNKLAQHNNYITHSKKIFDSEKILPKDLKRLQSTEIKDSYNRTFWINPNDNKGYHLLGEGKTTDGQIKIRILDENGIYIKDAQITPQKIILCDTENNEQVYKNIRHNEITNMLAKRYNPFAQYETLMFPHYSKDGFIKFLEELIQKTSKQKSIICCSFGVDVDIFGHNLNGIGLRNVIREKIKQDSPNIHEKITQIIKKFSSGNRILFSAGNDGYDSLNIMLCYKGTEGVGGLNRSGKIHTDSSSRNSIFTQHYENYKFPITQTANGINISGLHGTDYPLLSDNKTPIGTTLDTIQGTSFSAPIRAAKIALTEMMQGIL